MEQVNDLSSEQQLVPEQPGLFEDFVEYEIATTGQRFVNLLVDNILMRFGLSLLTGMLVGYIIGTFFPDYAERIVYNRTAWDLFVLSYAIAIFNYLVYYTICEKAFKGYTLGKLISGTRAIREDGGELTLKDAFLRSLIRLIPFEVFSGFADKPWHDAWTNTKVIKAR